MDTANCPCVPEISTLAKRQSRITTAVIFTIDFILLILSTKYIVLALTQFPQVGDHVNLHVFWFVPVSVVMDSYSLARNLGTMFKFARLGLLFGLITPVISLINAWYPAVLRLVGIHTNGASQLLLESFSDSFVMYCYQVIPTAVFGAVSWILIYALNRAMIKFQYAVVTPLAKVFVVWFKGVITGADSRQ